MPSATALYSTGRWLNAADIVDKVGMNKRIAAVIHHVEPELIGMGADQKTQLVIELVSRKGQLWPKKLTLNKTRSMAMVAAFGDLYETWPGNAIEVWAEMTLFSGKMVPSIKIGPAPNGAAPSNGTQQAQAPAPSPSPSATAIMGTAPVAGPNWTASPKPGTSAIEDDEIPF